jgi:hypothetical protein
VSTIFDDAVDFLNASLNANAGIAVTLSRKTDTGTVTCDAVAVIGRTVFSRVRKGTAGPSIEFGLRDYFVAAADYKLGDTGEVVEPADGDRIIDDLAGKLFELRPIEGEKSWRYSDPEFRTLRLHVQEIKDDS